MLTLCLFCLVVLKDTPWRSGKGEFESVPARHRQADETVEPDEPVAAEPVAEEPVAEEPVAEEPVRTTDQAKEDAE